MDVKKILDELYREKHELLEKVARLEVELETEKKLNKTLEKWIDELNAIMAI